MSRKKNVKASETTTAPVKDAPPSLHKTYLVPGQVAVALNTGRTQFIDALIKQVRDGHVLEPAQVIGMLELVKDWTRDRYEERERNATIRRELATALTSLRDLGSCASELLEQVGDTVIVAHKAACESDGR